MKYTILFLLFPFIGFSQIGPSIPPTWKNIHPIQDSQFIPIDTSWVLYSFPVKDPYTDIDLPEEECQIWYVRDFGTLAEYQGPAKLEWERIPEEERKFYRVTRIKNVHVPSSIIDEWRMIRVRNKTIWR